MVIFGLISGQPSRCGLIVISQLVICAWLLHRLFRDSIYFTPVVGAGGSYSVSIWSGLLFDGDELADFFDAHLDFSVHLRSIPEEVKTTDIWGALPFIGIQLVALIVGRCSPKW